ncbi:MAG TPA: addiction module antidote protein, HigA family [Dehalococcoidia bacterium]|nr:addiction module antidote protein, HigA family [Dehalococcoidia bacterium]
MARRKLHPFSPDYAIHPGKILEETLASRNIQKGELAERCGLSAKTVSQIIGSRAPLTPETAIQLERVLGIAARVWSNLDANYRLFQARRAAQAELRDNEEWIKQFPITHLINRGIIRRNSNKIIIMEQLLNFFGIGSIAAWHERIRQMDVAYRQSPSFQSSPASVATWLRIGELRAEGVICEPYNKSKFEMALDKIRGLTRERPEVFEPQMKALCAKSGVILVFVAKLPKTHLSGTTRWLTSDKALIMLSLRHKTDDHFWFSFFHEAGHILLHGRKAVFLDGDLI